MKVGSTNKAPWERHRSGREKNAPAASPREAQSKAQKPAFDAGKSPQVLSARTQQDRAHHPGHAETNKLEHRGVGAAEAAATTEPAETPDPVSAIASTLETGQIGVQTAIGFIVDQIVAEKLPANAPAEARAQLESHLRESLASDPFLVEKLSQLND